MDFLGERPEVERNFGAPVVNKKANSQKKKGCCFVILGSPKCAGSKAATYCAEI